jgi:ribosomal protein L3 glutamine methyltransferase
MFALLNGKKRRLKLYEELLSANSDISVSDAISIGTKLMKKARLHHHYHGSHSIEDNAESLVNYALDGEYHDHNRLSKKVLKNIFDLYERRISERIPTEYITNEATYYGNKFYINNNVLVPRSLIEHRFIDFLNSQQWYNYKVLDLCCGSGCIGITLALLDPKISVTLSDISIDAINVANKNIDRFGLGYRVNAIQGDMFENVSDKFDIIISNPPYVPTKHYLSAPKEFLNEPRIALESGKMGVDFTNKLLNQARKYLTDTGSLIVEVGVPAAKTLKKQHTDLNFEWLKYKRKSGHESMFALPCAFKISGDQLY